MHVLLPLGAGLLLAVRAPRRWLPLLWLGTAISVAHTANHTYELLLRGPSELGTVLGLALPALLLGLATASV